MGVGNAIVDVIAEVEESFVEKQNLIKGSMSLIRRIISGQVDRGLAHATSGTCLQQNLVCILEGE